MIRRSRGKPRPELPRRAELRAVDGGKVAAVREARAANDGRDSAGRFARGNGGARNRGWKMPIAKLLGRDIADPVAAKVAADAFRTYGAELRELPHDGPIVRSLCAQHAHHVALGAYWAAQAFDRVLGTPESIAAEERAKLHGQRAERLAVTLLDVAGRMATSTKDTRAQSAVLAAAVARLEASRRQSYDPDSDEDEGGPPSAQDGQGRANDKDATHTTKEGDEP